MSNPNHVTSATDLNGMPVLVQLIKGFDDCKSGRSDIVVGKASEITAQGIMIILGERGSTSLFVPWSNIAYIKYDTANLPDVNDRSTVVAVDVSII